MDAQQFHDALQLVTNKSELIRLHTFAFARNDISVTYLPAFLGNVWKLEEEPNPMLVIKAMELYTDIALRYQQQNPLSFALFKADVIKKFREYDFDSTMVSINDKGEATFNYQLELMLKDEMKRSAMTQVAARN